MKIKIILIIFAVAAAACFLIGCTEIKLPETLTYVNLNENLNYAYSKINMDSGNLNIFDYKSEGFMIQIDKNNDIIDFMLETIDMKDETGSIITINFQKDKSALYKYENGSYDLYHDTKLTKSRINVKDFMDFLTVLDYRSILAPFENSDTDLYGIGTNGLFRIIIDNDFVNKYVCYEYNEGNLKRLSIDDVGGLTNGDYFLPVYLSTGEIIDRADCRIHTNNLSAVVLVKLKM